MSSEFFHRGDTASLPSATVIVSFVMTMSVFEFSEPGNASAFTRHISN